jgi:hypothetical protein
VRFECQAKNLQIISQKSSQNFSLLRILNLCTKIPSVPDLFCIEIKRHARDLGVSVVLQANCELMARREALRLYPEFKHNLVMMEVYLAQYAEIDWDSGRSVVVKQVERPEIPPCVVKKVGMKRLKLPRLEQEGEE